MFMIHITKHQNEWLLKFLRNLMSKGKTVAAMFQNYKYKTFFSILMVITLIVCQGCGTKEIFFYVENAALLKKNEHIKYFEQLKTLHSIKFEKKDELLMQTGHRIIKGHGTVIALRANERPLRSLFYTDSTYYENISIFIPSQLSDRGELSISSKSDAIIFYSRGVFGFPEETGCSGYADTGKIYYAKVADKKISFEIYFKALIISNGARKEKENECIPDVFNFNKTFILDQQPIDSVNAGLYS